MEKKIAAFWNHFSSIQNKLIASKVEKDILQHDKLFASIQNNAVKIHPQLRVLLMYSIHENNVGKLIFLTKGNYKIQSLILKVVAVAPTSDLWEYQIGLPPYSGSLSTLYSYFNWFKQPTIIYQIYFAILKVYKSSNKMHLLIFCEMDRICSKAEIRMAIKSILNLYLGDNFYYNHISRFKVVRRKFSNIRFLPLEELRNLILYKNFN
ncbi:MAG: hypothetical protein CL526_07855 [Aequorivita sp.]|nr:hypothetical protein [Aequorivita sp.]|tara:strand:- start:14907 stop:15530 length:624 start_codon:yes stop_codon:yes gene_type:complete